MGNSLNIRPCESDTYILCAPQNVHQLRLLKIVITMQRLQTGMCRNVHRLPEARIIHMCFYVRQSKQTIHMSLKCIANENCSVCQSMSCSRLPFKLSKSFRQTHPYHSVVFVFQFDAHNKLSRKTSLLLIFTISLLKRTKLSSLNS